MKPALAYCHMIARVVAADGQMNDAEREILETAMEQAELSDDERDAVRHFEGAEEADAALESLDQETKERLRDELLKAVLVDGKISALERDAIDQITRLMKL